MIRNTELASMFASLFHDLVWVHRVEIADKLGISVREVLRLGNDVFRLAWKFIDPSLVGRIKSWAAFQAVEFAAPWYHALKTTVAVSAVLFVAGCSGGCYSLPDGEVEDAGGIEEVRRIMDVYGDGLGPDPAGLALHPRSCRRARRGDRLRVLGGLVAVALSKKWKNRPRWTCERCGREYFLPDGPSRTVKRETGASAWTMIGGLKTCEACAAARFKRRRTLGGGVLGERVLSIGFVRKVD